MTSLFLTRLSNPPPSADELYFIGFNQDHSCMAAGVSNGFRIFNCVPYKETFKREFSGSIGQVEMLFRCNILALVGGGPDPAFSKNKVILWDDNQSTPIGELAFKSEVKSVKLRRDKIVVVLEKHVYVYNFDKLERTHKFDTYPNAKGLVALSANEDCVLAFPHTEKGYVRIELITQRKNHIIHAHDNTIACLSLNLDGSRLATASEKGTLIRIFDTAKGTKLQEVRRGVDRAEIYSLCFSHDGKFFVTSSDKGTVHIFALNSSKDDDKKDDKQLTVNRKSKMSILGGYFGSEWSFAWFKGGPESPSICCFGQDNKSVVVVTAEGSFIRLAFDPLKGGECTRKAFSRYYKKNTTKDAKK
jgi:WD40 repeat protein